MDTAIDRYTEDPGEKLYEAVMRGSANTTSHKVFLKDVYTNEWVSPLNDVPLKAFRCSASWSRSRGFPPRKWKCAPSRS